MFSEEAGSGVASVKALIDATGVGNFDELYALSLEFPSLADDKTINLRDLSYFAGMRATSLTVQGIAAASGLTSYRLFATGARLSPDTAFGRGYIEPPPVPQRAHRHAVGATIRHISPRPVVDQGDRSTCVAHAMAAGAELAFPGSELSAQYAYWAAKLYGADPRPQGEGTWLSCAGSGMAQAGLCEEFYWPYAGHRIQDDQTHVLGGSAPSSLASKNAGARQRPAAFYDDLAHFSQGKSHVALQQLRSGPVVVSLPVFRDQQTGANNWHWFGATNYGHVLDPVPSSVLMGCHAVCLVGYVPSSAAQGGGWFIFKNSWGLTDWGNGGALAPASDPQLPKGYGYFSAAYVDTYLQELMRV